MEVECGTGPGRGRTHIDRWERTGARAAVTLPETLQAEGFFALLAQRLGGFALAGPVLGAAICSRQPRAGVCGAEQRRKPQLGQRQTSLAGAARPPGVTAAGPMPPSWQRQQAIAREDRPRTAGAAAGSRRRPCRLAARAPGNRLPFRGAAGRRSLAAAEGLVQGGDHLFGKGTRQRVVHGLAEAFGAHQPLRPQTHQMLRDQRFPCADAGSQHPHRHRPLDQGAQDPQPPGIGQGLEEVGGAFGRRIEGDVRLLVRGSAILAPWGGWGANITSTTSAAGREARLQAGGARGGFPSGAAARKGATAPRGRGVPRRAERTPLSSLLAFPADTPRGRPSLACCGRSLRRPIASCSGVLRCGLALCQPGLEPRQRVVDGCQHRRQGFCRGLPRSKAAASCSAAEASRSASSMRPPEARRFALCARLAGSTPSELASASSCRASRSSAR